MTSGSWRSAPCSTCTEPSRYTVLCLPETSQKTCLSAASALADHNRPASRLAASAFALKSRRGGRHRGSTDHVFEGTERCPGAFAHGYNNLLVGDRGAIARRDTPAAEVCPRASTSISPRDESLTVPLSQSVLGTRPICTKTPASARSWLAPVPRSCVTQRRDFAAIADDLAGLGIGDDAHIGQALQLVHQHCIARSDGANSSSVTWLTMPARSMAASTPELPPPTTATSLPLNSGPSQCGQ